MVKDRRLVQISRVPSRPGGPANISLEVVHENCRFKQYLHAGPTEYLSPIDGEWVIGERKRDIIQFYANPGGLRTVAADDIVGHMVGNAFRELEVPDEDEEEDEE